MLDFPGMIILLIILILIFGGGGYYMGPVTATTAAAASTSSSSCYCSTSSSADAEGCNASLRYMPPEPISAAPAAAFPGSRYASMVCSSTPLALRMKSMASRPAPSPPASGVM